MSSTPRIYSDANPIIELAKFGKGVLDATRLEDVEMMRNLLRASTNAEIDLYTSSISVAECVAAGDDWGPDVQEFFIGVLTSGRMFKLVQDTIFVAERARNLRWKDNIRLSGMDAIHVASALEVGCKEFLTWDKGMGNKVAERKRALEALGINVITPRETLLLPDFYRHEQQSLLPPS